MKRIFTLAALFGALTTALFVAPATSKPATKATVKSTMPKCEKCKMPLLAKADKMHSVAVRVNGKTLYCCAGCGAHKNAKKTIKAATKEDTRKSVKVPMCPKCNMQMSFTKSPLKATAMKVNGTTYYCCSICPRH